MKKHTNPAPVSDEQVRTLLERYACPVPFHEVRTRFLGNIASPAMEVSPIKIVADLWGGELPEFETIDAANELIGALIAGLWNRLTRHQDRAAPFRLTRIEAAASREGLAAVALMRRQELDGFIEGLFGRKEEMDFPERAHRSLSDLAEMRALFAAVVNVATDETKPGTPKDMETTIRHMREMTKNAEHEIHAIVLSCKRARQHMLAALQVLKDLPCKGRRVAVLGDMGELGASSESAHEEVGRHAAESGADQLFAVGKMASEMGRGARAAGLNRVIELADVDAAAGALKKFLKAGDLVLLKASRATRFEIIASVLKS